MLTPHSSYSACISRYFSYFSRRKKSMQNLRPYPCMGRLTSMTNNLEGNSRQSNNFQYSRVCRLEWTFDNNPSSAKQGVKVPAENFLVCVRRINDKSHHINTAYYIGTAGPSRRHLLFLIRKATVSDTRDPDPLSRLIS